MLVQQEFQPKLGKSGEDMRPAIAFDLSWQQTGTANREKNVLPSSWGKSMRASNAIIWASCFHPVRPKAIRPKAISKRDSNSQEI